ncbi:MAG: hypothetical protein OEM96_09280, partial [Gemmatimonadota bacterium]|nr:hypothetical protein [Gemmatimonadota bacterium]
MSRIMIVGLTSVWLAALSVSAPAQEVNSTPVDPTAELVDRIAAVVGDTVILYTEILEGILQIEAQGTAIPARETPAFDSLVLQTLQDLVNQLVLLQQAEVEELEVSDDVLEAETDRRFR